LRRAARKATDLLGRVGGSGADTLYGLDQNDSLYGGAGDDSLNASSSATDVTTRKRRATQRAMPISRSTTRPAPDLDTRAAPKDCEF
jgi:Ca2+-binding RTX toxin-like protein